MERLTQPRAVLFDMDGTLTRPILDFERIRREIGIASGVPILEALAAMSEARRQAAVDVLLRHEAEAAERAEPAEGCHESLAMLQQAGIPAAIVTRNSLASTRLFVSRYKLPIAAVVTREDAPHKPAPDPLLLALQRMGLMLPNLRQVWMIGDGEHDIASANAAGARAIWISFDRDRSFAATPCLALSRLADLPGLLNLVLRT